MLRTYTHTCLNIYIQTWTDCINTHTHKFATYCMKIYLSQIASYIKKEKHNFKTTTLQKLVCVSQRLTKFFLSKLTLALDIGNIQLNCKFVHRHSEHDYHIRLMTNKKSDESFTVDSGCLCSTYSFKILQGILYSG
jgi:hypothetical protein